MKKKVNIFVSYAHRNSDLAKNFIDEFYDFIKPSKSFEYAIWNDLELKPGDNWNEEIISNLDKSDCGILLISTSFLNSKYITKLEIPKLIDKNKVLIPVLLQKVDFERHDLKGLEKFQIYRFNAPGFKAPRSYSELKSKRKADFISELFIKMEEQLKNNL